MIPCSLHSEYIPSQSQALTRAGILTQYFQQYRASAAFVSDEGNAYLGNRQVSVQAMVVGGLRTPPGIECPKFAVGTLRLPAIICTIRFFPTVALHTDSDVEEFERTNLNQMSSDVKDMAQI